MCLTLGMHLSRKSACVCMTIAHFWHHIATRLEGPGGLPRAAAATGLVATGLVLALSWLQRTVRWPSCQSLQKATGVAYEPSGHCQPTNGATVIRAKANGSDGYTRLFDMYRVLCITALDRLLRACEKP